MDKAVQPIESGVYQEIDTGKWGMVIDQDLCTGCQACVAACSMENNVPFVGEDDVAYGRSQQWIRIERFWDGNYPEVAMTPYQPVMCQQCHNAPCEPVCPVYAAVHSMSEDINLQVYNRCVGTRYCANNCPYVARVFNWRDYMDPRQRPELQVLSNQWNPDVTVRRRGVMEKCTFCIQRIMEERQHAIEENRAVKGSNVTTACQDACPAEAIVFGDMNDKNSTVYKYREHQAGYRVLEEINVGPNVTYIARLRNVESETEKA